MSFNTPLKFSELQIYEGQLVMAFPLEPDLGSQVEFNLWATKKVQVWLIGTDPVSELDLEMQIAEGDYLHINEQLYGFHTIQLRQTPSTIVGLSAHVTTTGEVSDPEPSAFEPSQLIDSRISEEARRDVIQTMHALGHDREQIMDLLTGLNEDEDLSFDDEEDLLSEAQMADMIDEAARGAPVLEDPADHTPQEPDTEEPEPDT